MQSCETVNEDLISKSSKETHKSNIKAKITIAAFKYLIEKQSKHSKVKDIKYTKLETQQNMKSPLFTNEEVSLLYKLRSMAIGCKSNFKNNHSKNDLFCRICHEEEEKQVHILKCKIPNYKLKIKEILTEQVKYEYIYKDLKKLKVITTMFFKLQNIRQQILENEQNPNNQNNPSNPDGLLKYN